MTQRNSHGGARAGAGRKGGPSEVVRLPLPVANLARRLKTGVLRAGDINGFLDVEKRTPLIRCSTTAILRASATVARLLPWRCATFVAQAFNPDHFLTRCSMTSFSLPCRPSW